MRSLRNWGLGSAVALGAAVADAQQVRGVVRDSTTGQRMAGAVVMALDSAAVLLGRTLTNDSGAFVLNVPANARRLRLVRLGYRPRDVAIAGATRVDVAMIAVPTMLQALTVTATPGCPRRSDAARALSLFEQARAGLLATIVAREANPARMVLYSYDRTYDGTSDRIAHQRVWVDSSDRAKVTFTAGQSAKEFVRSGFSMEGPGGSTFLGPDAEVLLSESFATAYCFGIARGDGDRPNQVGLQFEAANSRLGRVDIVGALWVDTAKKALVDIEYRYVGLGKPVEVLRPGGSITFRSMENGVVLIDRWLLRIIGGRLDTLIGGNSPPNTLTGVSSPTTLVRRFATGGGGELARARWPDGKTWQASLGHLRVAAVRKGGVPAAGAEISLDDTPYRGRADSSGHIEIGDLVPGPYAVVVRDSLLEQIDVVIPTTLRFSAVRDSVYAAHLLVPTARDYILDRCVDDGQVNSTDTTRFIARVVTPTGEPIDAVHWTLRRQLVAGDNPGAREVRSLLAPPDRPPTDTSKTPDLPTVLSRGVWKVIREGGETGTDGLFQVCNGGLAAGTRVALQAWRRGFRTIAVDTTLVAPLTALKIVMTPAP